MKGMKHVVLKCGLVVGGLLCATTVRSDAAHGSDATPSVDPPNIVVVKVDDVRADELGSTGHPFARTPHIDRIAAEGIRFRDAFVTTPLCSPSRASFLTGQYAYNHGIVDNSDRCKQSHGLETFPRILQDGGYETAFIGKWHMGHTDSSPRPGFDYWLSFKGQGEIRDPAVNENGTRYTHSGYTTDVFNEKAVAFVQRRRDSPFLLYLSHKAVHTPFTPARRHRRLYADEPIARRPNVPIAGGEYRMQGKPALLRQIDGVRPIGPKTVTPEDWIRRRQRMLVAVDEGVGEILQALEEVGQLDDTVFVFTSDQGYFYGEHGLRNERRLAYEESIRIPLFVRYPKRVQAAGAVVDGMVLNIDLAPTLLELAGLDPPRTMDGRSVVPLLNGALPDDWRRAFLIEYYTDTVFARIRNMGYQAVRTERHKYIQYNELDGMDELYDLESDPYEMINLIDDPGAQELVGQLKAQLATLRGADSGAAP